MTLLLLLIVLRRWGPFLLLAGPLALGGGAGLDGDGSLDLWLRSPIVAVREADDPEESAELFGRDSPSVAFSS